MHTSAAAQLGKHVGSQQTRITLQVRDDWARAATCHYSRHYSKHAFTQHVGFLVLLQRSICQRRQQHYNMIQT